MPNSVKIKIDNISLNLITMSLTPAVIGLQKSDLELSLNNIEFKDYIIVDKSLGNGSIYSIIPNIDFFTCDILDIQILKEGFESDKVKIIFATAFSNDTAKIEFKLPRNVQGKYVIKLMTVNGIEFNISSKEIMVCRPINE